MTSNIFQYRNGLIYDPKGNYPVGVQTPSGDVFSTLLVAQSGIPVIYAPNGTVAANGQITLGTALNYIPPNCWLCLPAGAIVGGAVGMYFCQMSSTTVGQVFANFAASSAAFVPYIPGASSLVAAVGSGSAYTQTSGAVDTTIASILVPGGLMGPNGSLRFVANMGCFNSAGSKTPKANFGADIFFSSSGVTTSTQVEIARLLRNTGAVNKQTVWSTTPTGYGFGASGGTPLLGTVDTSVDQLITVTARLSAATDWLSLDGFSVEVLPGA